MRSLLALEIASVGCDHPEALLAACIDPSDDSVLSLGRDANASTVICRNGQFITGFQGTLDAVVSFKYLSANDCLCICLGNGDLWNVPLDVSSEAEIVGSIEGGIKAAEWSPDEELLVLINGLDQLLLLTRDFEVLSEGPIRTEDFGEDQPVNVGWGHADTQFRGSIGKSAGRTTNVSENEDFLDPTKDDFTPRISWRGDSAHFSVSCVDPSLPSTSQQGFRRVLRFYSRIARLQATSESSPGMEHTLAWQPSGSIIASTMRTIRDGVSKRDVIFFERNGLRRYDFPLRETEQSNLTTKSLLWNADSSLLALWVTIGQQHFVQIFVRNNYHWYLKQEILSKEPLVSCFWHPEKALKLYTLTEADVTCHVFEWEVIRSAVAAPNDSGLVAVVDGTNLLLTPFRYQNIPPPMSTYSVKTRGTSAVPSHVTFATAADVLAAFYHDLKLDLWTCTPRVKPTLTSSLDLEGLFPPEMEPLQLAVGQVASKAAYIFVLCYNRSIGPPSYHLFAVEGNDQNSLKLAWQEKFAKEQQPQRISIQGDDVYICAAPTNEVFVRTPSSLTPSGIFLPDAPSQLTVVQHVDSKLITALSQSGRLSVSGHPIESMVTSFVLCGAFLIYTTSSHVARFIPLDDLLPSNIESLDINKCETRRVERGSKIATAVISTMSLVLQMPRGNLEIIYPRPLVLQVVRQLIKEINYKDALVHCRKHRIDLNILYDEDPTSFITNLETVIDQIDDSDHLNLFLTSLKNEGASEDGSDLLSDKVNRLCQAIRSILLTKDLTVYINTILTTYVCQQPADYESALQLVMQLKASDPELADEAIKYLIFLSDTNKLYDVALGLYDFNLVLLVAQHSQKDPKEYLPFLREIKQLDPLMQRFKIDDFLKQRTKALQSLVLAGPAHFDEVKDYVVAHQLYDEALRLYRQDATRLKTMHGLFGDYLQTQSKLSQAGLHFTLAKQTVKAIEAYAEASDWQEAFALALATVNSSDPAFDVDRIPALASSVSERLQSTGRHGEAARVLLDYGQDVEASIKAFCEGHLFSEAVRIAHLYSQANLIESIVATAVEEAADTQLEAIDELSAQVAKQVTRLDELMGLRARDPDAYFGNVDLEQLDTGVELDDSASTVGGTMFTRYTAAPTQLSRSTMSSATSSKAKRKEARKKHGGMKKGTIWEEDYLLGSLSRTCQERLSQLQKEIGDLLPSILTLSRHSSAAVSLSKAQRLQARLQSFETQAQSAISHIWDPRKDDLIKHDVVGMVKRPTVAGTKWSLAML